MIAAHEQAGSTSQKRCGGGFSQLWPWLVLALPWLILLNHLRLEWTVNAQYGYGFFVPLLAGYLAVLRWPTRPEPRPPETAWLPGLVTVPVALLFLPFALFAESSPDWRLLSWSLAAATVALSAGAVFYRAGWPWLRHFAFPLLFILVAVPWPMPLENRIVNALTAENASAAAVVANWCGVPAIVHQNVVQLAAGTVGVDDACSGVRSLQTTLMSALFFGEWLLLGVARRFLLLLAGLTLALVCNFLRILTLIWLLVSSGHPTMEAGHDLAGWSVVAATFAGLWLVAKRLAPDERPAPAILAGRQALALRPWPRAALLALALWLVITQLGAQAWFAWHETRLAAPVRWTIQWPREAPQFSQVPIAPTTQMILKYQHGSSVQWLASGGAQRWSGFFFRWDASHTASILARSHRPDICLPATGRELVQDFGVETYEAAGLELPVRVYQFADNGQPLFVFYCTWEDRRPSAVTIAPEQREMNRLKVVHRWRAVMEGQRNNGQQTLEVIAWGCPTKAAAAAAFTAQICPLIRRMGER